MKKLFFQSFIIVFLFACDNPDPTTVVEPVVEPINDQPLGNSEDLQQAALDFSMDIFKEIMIEKSSDDNLLISPLSIETALYMTINGAQNNTLAEMHEALHLGSLNISGLNENYKNLASNLVNTDMATLGLANGIFYDTRMSVNDDFKERITQNYNAIFEELSFADPASVDYLNDWASEKTEGRITEILEEIDPEEVMFLINALYFTGDWETGFADYATHSGNFTKQNGKVLEVDIMHSDNPRSFFVDDQIEMVDLPFKGNEFSMSFIKTKGQSVTEWITGMDVSEFVSFYNDAFESKLQQNRVYLNLPKFEISDHLLLKDILVSMGIKDAFDENRADLHGLGSVGGNLYISRVIHDSFLKIDEKGAEGAAVTVVAIAEESLPPALNFDEPFIFIIRHIETNTILFIGKMGDPS